MGRFIFIIGIVYLISSGLWNYVNLESGEYLEMTQGFTRSYTPLYKQSGLIDKANLPSVLVGKWEFETSFTSEKTIDVFNGVAEYSSNGTFKKYVTQTFYESHLSYRFPTKEQAIIKFSTGGLIHGEINFNTGGNYWKERITSCNGNNSVEQGLCDVINLDFPLLYGSYENSEERFEIKKLSQKSILIEGFNFVENLKIRHLLRRTD